MLQQPVASQALRIAEFAIAGRRSLVRQLKSHPAWQSPLPEVDLSFERLPEIRVALFNPTGEGGLSSNPYDLRPKAGQPIGIDGQMVNRMKAQLDMFVVPGEPVYLGALAKKLDGIGAIWGEFSLPDPVRSDDARVLVFPKGEPLNERVAGAFREEAAVDFGEYLSKVVQRQYAALAESSRQGDSEGDDDGGGRPRG